jgi:hypothetical protein
LGIHLRIIEAAEPEISQIGPGSRGQISVFWQNRHRRPYSDDCTLSPEGIDPELSLCQLTIPARATWYVWIAKPIRGQETVLGAAPTSSSEDEIRAIRRTIESRYKTLFP